MVVSGQVVFKINYFSSEKPLVFYSFFIDN
jgi:hypothetical protein